MEDIVKLDIMSDGSVSLDGTRITPNKMYGIQSVVKSVAVSKESIINALDVARGIREKAIDEFAEVLKSDEFQKYNLDMVFETSRDLSYSHCINAFCEYIDEVAKMLKGGAE